MREKVTALLIPFVVIALANLATYFKMTIPGGEGTLWGIGTIAAALVVGYFSKRGDQKKITRAESIAPGITQIPPGSATKAEVKIQDPRIPDIKHENPETP